MNVGFRVVTQIDRPDEAIIARFREYRSCDISDAMLRSGTMLGIRAVYEPIGRVVGPAVTASLPVGGINMVKMAMAQTRPGDVLVMSAQGDTSCAYWGGNVSTAMKARGVAGVIVDGGIRDISEIRNVDLPVFARGVAVVSANAVAPWGEVNVPIACGSTVVAPGDLIVADEDGIVVIPREAAADVLKKTAAVVEMFAGLQPMLRRGEVTRIAEIQATLIELGLEIDEAAGKPSEMAEQEVTAE